jgi:hypothetical protein
MTAVAVRCDGSPSAGWSCSVTLSEGGVDVSEHVVRVSASDLRRLSTSAPEPTALVRASFKFLLERESPQMILRSFDLLDIARYFPGYEQAIRRRVRVSRSPTVDA